MKDDDARDDLLRRLGKLAKEQAQAPAPDAPALDDLARERIVAHLAANVPRKKASRGPYVLAGALALAAGIAFAVTRLGEPDPLPEYALYASGDSSARGPAPAAPKACVLKAGTVGSFELVASTEAARVEGPLVARAFLVKGGAVVAFPGKVEVSPQGSVRLQDDASKLAGATELRVVVARSAGDAELKVLGPPWSGNGWQVLRCAIE
jgi:hypothetical protein